MDATTIKGEAFQYSLGHILHCAKDQGGKGLLPRI
jgi:hypothetical protein